MAKTEKSWLTVDRAGLADLIGDRGKEFIIYELLQNAWDEASTEVSVTFVATDQRGLYLIEVTDDNPEGFKDITHAYTLFAKSAKKDDPEKRGRFNLGEKLVLALCREAEIITTTGTIRFDDDGRHSLNARTASGTKFRALVRMNRAEYESALEEVKKVIPPRTVRTLLNGHLLLAPEPEKTIEATLTTVVADDNGVMRPTKRKTRVELHDAQGKGGTIYEMGIPVVTPEGADRWHYNVLQKVPLNSDRTNVTPAYLTEIRVVTVNNMVEKIDAKTANSPLVRDAMQSKNITTEATTKVLDERFGKLRVIADSSDPEATKNAVSKGYQVIYPRNMSAEEWGNAKRTGTLLPAGKVTPVAKPYSPDGKPLNVIDKKLWTDAMEHFAVFANYITTECFGTPLSSFTYADEPKWLASGKGTRVAATCGPSRELVINWPALKKEVSAAFTSDLTPKTASKLAPVIDILIHELAHIVSTDHLSSTYYHELTRLAGKVTALALSHPDAFMKHAGVAAPNDLPSSTGDLLGSVSKLL